MLTYSAEVHYFYKWWDECNKLTNSVELKPRLNKVKPPADASIFQRKFFEPARKKLGANSTGEFDFWRNEEMKIVIVPSGFKECLDAEEVAARWNAA